MKNHLSKIFWFLIAVFFSIYAFFLDLLYLFIGGDEDSVYLKELKKKHPEDF
jgi:hypothetical protein